MPSLKKKKNLAPLFEKSTMVLNITLRNTLNSENGNLQFFLFLRKSPLKSNTLRFFY